MERIENVILRNLICDEAYARRVIPYLKDEYFGETDEKILFKTVNDYILKYNNVPSKEALGIVLAQQPLNTEVQKKIDANINYIAETFNQNEKTDEQWLLDATELFCQEKSIYNAVLESINILDNKGDSKLQKGAIPTLLSDALSVSFDTNIGHDYFDDAEARYEFYHKKQNKIPFDLEYFNLITKGGIVPKTLNVIMAGTNVGKSLIMCHLAASYITQGYNVLYITLEMAEEAIAQRIDANLYNMNLDDVVDLPKENYLKRMDKIRSKVAGKLVIKEFPTASAHSIHFKNLLNDLNLKKNFKPSIVFIDYINICASSRIKAGARGDMYLYIKSIAEELRGLAVETNLPIWTATQSNRSGYASSDPDLTNTSESFGLPATADFMIAAITNEELEDMSQLMIKQLKNRYNDVTKYKRFVLGVDRAKMKLTDVVDQGYIADSGQTPEDDYVEVKSNKSDKFMKLRTE